MDEISKILEIIVLIALWLTWMKSVTIGSKFSFWLWMKYGKQYTKWYDEVILKPIFSPNQKLRRK